MNLIIRNAKKFINKYNLISEPLSVNRLTGILKEIGFSVMYYDMSNHELLPTKFIHAANLENQAEFSQALDFSNADHKIIFIKQGLSENDIISLMIYKIGHIYCDTTITYDAEQDITMQKEIAAYQFLNHVLHIINKNNPIKRITNNILVGFMKVLFKYVLQPYVMSIPKCKQMLAEVEKKRDINIAEEILNEIVIVTKTDNKYHYPDCEFLHNRKDVKQLTKGEAWQQSYIPCHNCNHNEIESKYIKQLEILNNQTK